MVDVLVIDSNMFMIPIYWNLLLVGGINFNPGIGQGVPNGFW